MINKKRIVVAASLVVAFTALMNAPRLMRYYWRARSSNPVRAGIAKAIEMGCFNCHGWQGRKGIPDPGEEDLEVPQWSGGVWMMYVRDDEEIAQFIEDGISKKRAASVSARKELEAAAVHMPAFKRFLDEGEVGDLVAAFKVLSGMNLPPSGSAARRGYDVARSFKCFSCHGAGASGGLPNPGSFTGFIPGWYGADFRDLVRDRDEFRRWIREGKIARLEKNPIARYFVKRQRIKMPMYREVSDGDIDALWAYTEWLAATKGGIESE